MILSFFMINDEDKIVRYAVGVNCRDMYKCFNEFYEIAKKNNCDRMVYSTLCVRSNSLRFENRVVHLKIPKDPSVYFYSLTEQMLFDKPISDILLSLSTKDPEFKDYTFEVYSVDLLRFY